MDNILVLMSVFNGEQYIKEQILSILGQIDVAVTLYIRDDGSTDHTVDIMKSIKSERIEVIRGDNIGPAWSFYELLRRAFFVMDEYHYFALADQDDIWMPNKLNSAVKMLKKEQADLYYGSLDAFINNDLTLHHVIYMRNTYSDVETMLRNPAAGCTMLFSAKVVSRICEYMPKNMEMHDLWIFRVCKYTGMKIVADNVPYIRYRLHENNICGAAVNFKEKVVTHFQNVFAKHENVSINAHELLNGYEKYLQDNVKEYLRTLDQTTLLKNRKMKLLKYCFKTKFSTISRKMDFIFEIITNRI